MSVSKDELYRLVEALPEKETLMVKMFLEFVLSEAEAKNKDKVSEQTLGTTFYIEGPSGKYAEMEFCYHLMKLDDVGGQGYFVWYNDALTQLGDVDFNKNDLPAVWPVYYALAAKCTIVPEPFFGDFKNREEVEMYVKGSFNPIPLNKIPMKLSSNLEVAKLMWSGKTYSKALTIIAQQRDLKSISTVGDQCTRQMGLNAKQFKELVDNKEKFMDHLIKHFPAYKDFIVKELS
ncbi:hypothetical protein E308F_16380 [Moorella sp. E308F]|uniref:hypothetical protein n=1 Tax=unclassified Neomoorella TaxID=2676739 RepID=UPI0010FFC591|nr:MULTISPECIES: hypothetical protein [unclassified Moorella (in: firmicutes)]GEA15394.1 hypothetical protein E308F_16380 [Moorella sp. E308F]GEA19746.1 hypothetical protein E306M_28850 [Moorella sp. E306M]